MKRSLIVIENKESEERFLWNPFQKGQPVVPGGYHKITSKVPLDEEKFGHYPIKEKEEIL
jgi:hypothetical protein